MFPNGKKILKPGGKFYSHKRIGWTLVKSLYISQVDTVFANGAYPIQFLLYYKSRLNTKHIRLALKKLAADFWPAFGEYRTGAIRFNSYSEIDHFEESSSGQEFDPGDSSAVIHRVYYQSIPADMNTLFFLKVIQYENGTVLLPNMSHLAGDGYSYFFLLSVLAALSRSAGIPFKGMMIRRMFKPHHNRTELKDFRFNLDLPSRPANNGGLTIEFEEVPRNHVRELIKNISSDFNRQVTPNDILSAITCKKLIALQTNHFSHDFQLTIPIDVRSLVAEYGAKFFGNGIMFGKINFEADLIRKLPVQELAIKIREGMPAVSRTSFMNFLEQLETIIAQQRLHDLKPFDPKRGVLVTNLSKLPVKKLNFGTGNPDYIFPLTIAKNSTAIIGDKDKFILRIAY